MTPAQAIAQNSSGTAVFLAEVTLGNRYLFFVQVSGTTYSTPDDLPVDDVQIDGVDLVQQASIAAVEASGGWYNDGTNTYFNAGSTNIFDFNNHSVQGFYTLYFSNVPKTFNGNYYRPGIMSLPSLSTKLEKKFSSVAEISGGDMVLNNEDKFLDTFREMQWDAGTTTIKFGWDFNGFTMAYTDYQQVANFINSARIYDEADFTLQMLDNKNRLKVKIPFVFYAQIPPVNPVDGFTYLVYPNIEKSGNGKVVPLAYGVNYGAEPVCVDTVNKIFQIASHPCYSLDEVRLYDSSTNEWVETIPVGINEIHSFVLQGTVPPSSGYITYAVNLPGVGIITTGNINYDDDTATIQSTFDSAFGSGNTLISGGPLSSGIQINVKFIGSYVAISIPISSASWPVNTLSGSGYVGLSLVETLAGNTLQGCISNANGAQFALGSDWSSNQQVSCDFKGRLNADGTFMANAADIVADLLTLVGEGDNINTASFTVAHNLLDLGFISIPVATNNRITSLKPCLYINSSTTVLDTINIINAFVASFVYVDANGQWFFVVFDPQPRVNLPHFDDTSMNGWTDETEQILGLTSVSVPYAQRYTDGWGEFLTFGIPPNKFIHKQPANTDTSDTVPTADPTDANLWSQRKLVFEGRTSRVFQGNIVRPDGLLLRPGDQIHVYWGVVRDSQGRIIDAQYDKVIDIIQVSLNFESDGSSSGSATTTVYCSDLRGWGDQPGFWTVDNPVIDPSLSHLAGYGTGSADPWNKNWHKLIKNYCRQSFGYWTNDNGYVDPTDPDSCLVSCWV